MDEPWKYLSVFFLSSLKFIFGPTLGISYGFPVVVTAFLTTGGMMLPVWLFTSFGEYIRRFTEWIRRGKKRKVFTRKNRRFVRVWKKYGLKGLAFLTPILLTPIGGALLANVFGGKRTEIFKWMLISASFWSIVITLIVKYAYWLVREGAVM